MEQLVYNKEFFEFLKGRSHKSRNKDVFPDSEADEIGDGCMGTVFVVEQKGWKYAVKCVDKYEKGLQNEINALIFLRDKMINGELPPSYVFYYGKFNDDGTENLILEKLDKSLDSLMVDYDYDHNWFITQFIKIAEAVKHLEAIKFNHGDLWNENVMVKFNPDDNRETKERDFKIILIDFDASFMANSHINKPNLGGSDSHRKRYLEGYDLNRYFDAINYGYDSYQRKKIAAKKKRIKRENIKLPYEMVESSKSEREYDEENYSLPHTVYTFIKNLKLLDIDQLVQNPKLSAVVVLEKLKNAFI